MCFTSFAILVLVITSACDLRLGPTTSTGSEADKSNEPYVEVSYDFDTDTPSQVVSHKPVPRIVGNSVIIGTEKFSVVEKTSGFSILRINTETGEVIEQGEFLNIDPFVTAYSNPRITNVSGDQFTLVMKVSTFDGDHDITYTISTQGTRITQR